MPMEKKLILRLSEIKERDKGIVGSKAFRLSQVVRLGFSVPPAFVLTTHLFDNFLEENDLFYLIERLRVEEDEKFLRRVGRKLQREILRGEISPKFKEVVKKEAERINGSFAVRSSATSEDLAFASFAGQFESYLNIPLAEIFKFIKTCWASVYEERVIAYTQVFGIAIQEIKMAVLVQKFTSSEKGGVLFTKDVIGDNPEYLVIEACRGQAESVVAGLAKPDRFIVEKKTREILSSSLQNEKALLSPKEIQELVKIGLSLERFYQTPQDIEWLIKNGKVYILQTRPVTT